MNRFLMLCFGADWCVSFFPFLIYLSSYSQSEVGFSTGFPIPDYAGTFSWLPAGQQAHSLAAS